MVYCQTRVDEGMCVCVWVEGEWDGACARQGCGRRALYGERVWESGCGTMIHDDMEVDEWERRG